MDDQNISRVGWYIGSYLLRFIEIEQDNNDDPEVRFVSWENTILVKANNLDEAYDKVVDHAKVETEPYKGGATEYL